MTFIRMMGSQYIVCNSNHNNIMVLCVIMSTFIIITIIVHTKHNIKISWMVDNVQTQNNYLLANESRNPNPTSPHHKNIKTNIMHKTHRNLHITMKCVRISNCHKWFWDHENWYYIPCTKYYEPYSHLN